MKMKQDYYSLQAEIDAIAEKHNCKYELTDPCVDSENAYPLTEKDGKEYWDRMYASLCDSAGMRAQEKGIDLNKELGQIIY